MCVCVCVSVFECVYMYVCVGVSAIPGVCGCESAIPGVCAPWAAGIGQNAEPVYCCADWRSSEPTDRETLNTLSPTDAQTKSN